MVSKNVISTSKMGASTMFYNNKEGRTKKNLFREVLIMLLCLSIGIYCFIPLKDKVSMSLFYLVFSLMIISLLYYFKAKKKSNYLDFDTIFIVVYCLVGFTTTFFYLDRTLFNDIFLGFPVDDMYINKSNVLFLIGLQSYMIGNLTIVSVKKRRLIFRVIDTRFLVFLVFILIGVFFVSGGPAFYQAEYTGTYNADGIGIIRYVLLFLVTTAMALIGTEFYNKKINADYKISKLAFLAMFFLILTLLFVGNRTAASQIILPIVCLFALLFRKVSFKQFLLFVFCGIIGMWFIQQFRTGEKTFKLTNPVMLILDLTIPVRNTYAAMDYVERNDYTYGESMVMGAAGIVPFMPSVIKTISPDIVEGSAELLTEYTFKINRTPDEVQIGLGTTIIADIYVAFGMVGVVILMFIMGYIVNKWTTYTLVLDYYSIILLCGMLGNAIFVVRASYVHPLRFVFWSLFLAMFNQFLSRVWKK